MPGYGQCHLVLGSSFPTRDWPVTIKLQDQVPAQTPSQLNSKRAWAISHDVTHSFRNVTLNTNSTRVQVFPIACCIAVPSDKSTIFVTWQSENRHEENNKRQEIASLFLDNWLRSYLLSIKASSLTYRSYVLRLHAPKKTNVRAQRVSLMPQSTVLTQ